MRHVAVLARAPSSGGKTRLTEGLDDARARALRSALLSDTLHAVASVDAPCTVFVTPPEAVAEVEALAGPGTAVVPQGEGDLGRRMHAAIEHLFASGAGQVVLVGSDLPSLPPSRLVDAFDGLAAGHDLILGPAEDGGYYLIGLARPQPWLFEGIGWGGSDVFRRTLDAAARVGTRPLLIDPWYDVDTQPDLRQVIESAAPAVRTRAWFVGQPSIG